MLLGGGRVRVASDERKLDLDVGKQLKRAAAAAKQEVLNRRAMEALLNTKPEDLIAANLDAEVIKGNARRSGCWIHAPGMVEFFAAADKRLTRVADWTTMEVKRVERVHANLVKGTKLVIIKPAPAEDLTAIPVNRYGYSATFNLITLLGEAGLTVETGYRERYEVAYIPKESPLWPGLVIDLSQIKERRLEPHAKKSDSDQTADANAVPGRTRRGRKGQGSAPPPDAGSSL